MGYARYIGRVGALAAALGVAAVVANTPGVALADDVSSNGSSSESSSQSSTDAAASDGPATSATPAQASPVNPSESDSVDVSNPPAQTSTSQTTTTVDTGPVTIFRSSGGALTSSPDTENTEPEQDAVIETEMPVPADQPPDAAPVQDPSVQDPPVAAVEPATAEQAKPADSEPDSSPPAAASPNSVSTAAVDAVIATVDDEPEAIDAAPTLVFAPQNIIDDQSTPTMVVADPAPAAESEQLTTTPAEQPTAAPFSGPLEPLNVVATALAGLFGSPLLVNGPAAPVEPPMLWAVMAWARKQFEQVASLAPVSGCACTNGLTLVQWGSATCQADGIGSFAFVLGNNSSAIATAGDFNTAIVFGNNSSAHAADGTHNIAKAIGDNSLAKAGVAGDPNDFNTAIAIDGGQAFAGSGGNENDGNFAKAVGPGSEARAGTDGDENDHNIAVALGADSVAVAGGFLDGDFGTIDFDPDNNDHNSAIAINSGQAVAGANGDNHTHNTALSAGPSAQAVAGFYGTAHDHNFVLVIGADSSASAGVSYFTNNDANAAVAIGQGSGASAGTQGCSPAGCIGDNNTGNSALAWGTNAIAIAGSGGDDQQSNTALAIGTDTLAMAGTAGHVVNNDDNFALAFGANSVARAASDTIGGGAPNNDNTGNSAVAINGARADAGTVGNDNDGNSAFADGVDSVAVAGGFFDIFTSAYPDNNDGNTATAINGGQAEAGADGDNNTGNTAFGAGPGSLASAGSTGDDQDGFTATAAAGVPVIVP